MGLRNSLVFYTSTFKVPLCYSLGCTRQVLQESEVVEFFTHPLYATRWVLWDSGVVEFSIRPSWVKVACLAPYHLSKLGLEGSLTRLFSPVWIETWRYHDSSLLIRPNWDLMKFTFHHLLLLIRPLFGGWILGVAWWDFYLLLVSFFSFVFFTHLSWIRQVPLERFFEI